jgi:hypothetical protein
MRHIIICLLLVASGGSFHAQYTNADEIKPGNNYDLTYINPDPIQDLRLPKAGTRAVAIMGLLPIDLPAILGAGDSTDNDLDNRLPEYIFPNLRFYRSDRGVTTIGLVYAQTSQVYKGDVVESTVSGSPASYYERMTKRKIALRIANDQHFNVIRFRRFDLDPYWGLAGSMGYSPVVAEENATYVGGDYTNYRKNSNYITFGLDTYFGCNVLLERFSLGLEMIAFGADFQRGAGVSKVKESASFGSNAVDREYYTSEDWQEGTEFSNLKVSENQISMYKGIRGIFCFYFNR